MNLLNDMRLFTSVVHFKSMRQAADKLGLSPASISMRIKKLEAHYQTKLLTRTTRHINLTAEGEKYYRDCLKVINEFNDIENKYKECKNNISGPLKITAPADLGRSQIASLLLEYARGNDELLPYLKISNSRECLVENNVDIAIQYGVDKKSYLYAKKLANNHQVLCASPLYIKRYGLPLEITDLKKHRFLLEERKQKLINKCYFYKNGEETRFQMNEFMLSNETDLIREWALKGAGIALRNIWDVADDIKAGHLVELLKDYEPRCISKSNHNDINIYAVYQNRQYMPKRIINFLTLLQEHFKQEQLND